MRKKVVIPFIILLAGVIFLMMSLSTIIKNTLVSSLQSVTGAKVEIKSVDVTYFPFGVKINHLALANQKLP